MRMEVAPKEAARPLEHIEIHEVSPTESCGCPLLLADLRDMRMPNPDNSNHSGQRRPRLEAGAYR